MSGETDKQIVQALALRSAAAGASGALASSHGTDWPARVSVRELEESGRYRVTVHGPGDPPPGDLGAAVLHAEGCAARVLAAPSGSSLQREALDAAAQAVGGAGHDPAMLWMRLEDLVADVKGRELRAEAEVRQWRDRWSNLCRELGLPAEGVPLEDVFRRVARLRGRGLGLDHAEVRVAADGRDLVKDPRCGDAWRLADGSAWRVAQVIGEPATGPIVGASVILVQLGAVNPQRVRCALSALPDLLFGATFLRAGEG